MLNLSKSQNLQEDSDHLINSESGICWLLEHWAQWVQKPLF